jgi:FHA domain/zinc-ribbon domain
MSQTSVCAACHKEIQPNQAFCSYCGSPQLALLPSRITVRVPDAPLASLGIPNRVIQLTRIYADILVFQIAGYEQPVLVKAYKGEITVGRYSPGEIAPSLDLNPYNGSVLGVSRQHAIITRNDEGYTIKDMGSTNGTWLNDVQLEPQRTYPLHSGDLIRAAQVIMNIYFRLPSASDRGEIGLTLKNEFNNTAPLKLTIEHFQSVLTPYLAAVSGFQQVVVELLGQSQSEVVITSMAVDAAKSVITVNMMGIDQAFRFLAMNTARWREMHSEELRLKHTKPAEGQSVAPNQNDTFPNNNTLHKALRELALEVLGELLPDNTSVDQSTNLSRLLSHLETLALSPLRVIPEN